MRRAQRAALARRHCFDISRIAYGVDSYQNAGLQPFLSGIRHYFARRANAPVVEVGNSFGDPFYLTFSDEFLGHFLTHTDEMQKAYECAIKYGFRGFSTGGKNGIFLQRESDTPLIRATDQLVSKNAREVASVFEVVPEEFSTLRRVKVVYHNKARVRWVGVLNDKLRRLLFLGTARHV